MALIGFASDKNAVKDAIYSSVRVIVVLLIGDYLLQEPYDEYYFTVIHGICLAIFPAFYFGMTEISKGRLKWVETTPSALPKTEKNKEYMVTDKDVYIENLEKLNKLAELRDKGILSAAEFAIEKAKALKEDAPLSAGKSEKNGAGTTTIVHIHQESNKNDEASQSRIIAFLLCLFFGYLGFHRFYTGSVFLGLLYLLTGGILGIGWFFDLLLLLCGTYHNGRGQYL